MALQSSYGFSKFKKYLTNYFLEKSPIYSCPISFLNDRFEAISHKIVFFKKLGFVHVPGSGLYSS